MENLAMSRKQCPLDHSRTETVLVDRTSLGASGPLP